MKSNILYGRTLSSRIMNDEAEDSNDDKEKKLTVETSANHVYFYADVDTDRCLAMIKEVRDLDNTLRNERLTRNIPDGENQVPIWLHIQSNGGDLFAGLAAADQLEKFTTPIYSIVEGVCASAGTLISLACDRKYITQRSYMLVHQFWSVMWGKYEEFKDEMALQDMLIETLAQFYVDHTKMDETQVKAYLKRDSWFNSEKCIELGLTDEVI
jgi:ATP-dependent protease ClpP protease subunit